jgi:hypothetical protein
MFQKLTNKLVGALLKFVKRPLNRNFAVVQQDQPVRYGLGAMQIVSNNDGRHMMLGL